MDLPAAARFTAQIEPGDAYTFDDTATLDVPAAPAVHRVKLVGEERSCLKEILAANRRVELIRGRHAGKRDSASSTARRRKSCRPARRWSSAPGACDLWQLGEAVADPLVTRVDDSSPIVAGVRLFDAYLPEARQLQIAESVRRSRKPILWAGATPLGYAIDRPQGRVVVIAGDLATSNLAQQAAFPQLVAQALDWLDGQAPWKDEVVLCKHAGEHESNGSYESHRSYGSHVCLTSLRRPPTFACPATSAARHRPWLLKKPWPPLWIVPAVLAAVLVILEWCLYQRRWTS